MILGKKSRSSVRHALNAGPTLHEYLPVKVPRIHAGKASRSLKETADQLTSSGNDPLARQDPIFVQWNSIPFGQLLSNDSHLQYQ